MNEKQFSDRIGNVNDKLIRQAEQIPNYRRGHRRRSIRQLATIAAVIALMVCSFSVGALAFSEKIYVEKNQEIIDSFSRKNFIFRSLTFKPVCCLLQKRG